MAQIQDPITLRLADHVKAIGRHSLSPRALSMARTGIIDTIGVTLAGVPENCTKILLKTPGVATAPGNALVMGTKKRTTALDAAFINGTASHALDYDDFSSDFGGHQSVPLVRLFLRWRRNAAQMACRSCWPMSREWKR